MKTAWRCFGQRAVLDMVNLPHVLLPEGAMAASVEPACMPASAPALALASDGACSPALLFHQCRSLNERKFLPGIH